MTSSKQRGEAEADAEKILRGGLEQAERERRADGADRCCRGRRRRRR